MKAVQILVFLLTVSGLTHAATTHLKCTVEGIQTIDTIEKKDVQERTVNIKIDDNPNEIIFNIQGMPGGFITIRGSKKFSSANGKTSLGTSSEEIYSAIERSSADQAVLYQRIEVSRLNGKVSFETSFTVLRTASEKGFEMQGECKLDAPKQRF